MAHLTQTQIKKLLHYDPSTGRFIWRQRKYCKGWNKNFEGKEAGTIRKFPKTNYRIIHIYGRDYCAHRLAFLYITGNWPEEHVDHKDRNGLNNCWDNLRSATRSQNMANRCAQPSNPLKMKGVYQHRRTGRYGARIGVRGKMLYLGCYNTPEEAQAAYYRAAKKHHGEYARA